MRSRVRLLAFAGFAVAGSALAFACTDRDSSPSPTQPGGSPAGTATATAPLATPTPAGNSLVEPIASLPVSQYVVLVQDLGVQNFLTDLAVTQTLKAADYAATPAFASAEEGIARLEAWGYVDGYRTGLLPEGGTDAILQGAYVVFEEFTAYETVAGAKEAFAHLAANVRANRAVEVIEAATVANESIASRATAGKLGSTTVDQVLHQLIFRRGNVVVRLVTGGAAPLMTVQTAIELAAIVDAKILGEREHPEPTPTPQRSPTPTPAP